MASTVRTNSKNGKTSKKARDLAPRSVAPAKAHEVKGGDIVVAKYLDKASPKLYQDSVASSDNIKK